jgi:hypothetical protein
MTVLVRAFFAEDYWKYVKQKHGGFLDPWGDFITKFFPFR